MELSFPTVYGTNHVLYGLGYGEIVKTHLPDSRVRSAKEQIEIHRMACEFDSDILYIPRPHALLSDMSYTMEELVGGKLLRSSQLWQNEPLANELVRFHDFMVVRGYFPSGYCVLKMDSNYALCDFSQFGSVQGDRVRFPKDPEIYTLESAKKKAPKHLWVSE